MLLKKEICQDYFNEMSLEEMNAVIWIYTALEKAKVKHPKFSKGKIMYGQSIVLEEAGKLTRTVNKFIFERGSIDEVVFKAASVGATVVRLLILLERKRKRALKLKKWKPIECGCADGQLCEECKKGFKPLEGLKTVKEEVTNNQNENEEEKTQTETPGVH